MKNLNIRSLISAFLTLSVSAAIFTFTSAFADVVVVPGGGPRGPVRPPVVVVPGGGPRPGMPVGHYPPPPYHPPVPPYHPPTPPYYPPAPPHYPPPPPPHYPPSYPGNPGSGGVVVVPGGGPMHTPPAGSNQPSEQDAADIIARSIAGLGCEKLSDAVRNLSNQLLANVAYATQRDPSAAPPPMLARPTRPTSREEFIQRWLQHLTNPELMQKLWGRLADLYRSCDRPCFDDGVAIGQLSGAGYCAGSVGAGGLSGIGAITQAPLPLCQNSNFVGCQQGYYDAAQHFEGCTQYTQGNYTQVFRDFISQDCHSL